MSKPDPQFGVALSTSEVNPALEVSAIYGVTPTNKYIPIAVDSTGKLSVSLSSSTIEIGKVDQGDPNTIENAWPIKLTDGTNTVVVNSDGSINADISASGSIPVSIDHNLDSIAIYGFDGSSDQFIKTDSSGNLKIIQATNWPVQLEDGSGNSITSTTGSLNVNITGGTTAGPTAIDSGSIVVGQLSSLGISLSYGYNGSTWERILSSSNRLIVDGSQVTQPISGSVSVSNFPATQAVTQSTSPWVISGTVTANAGTGNFTVVQPTAANLNATVSGTVTTVPPSNASTNITQIAGSSLSLGQNVSASSVPVVIASDQSTITVTGTVTTSPNVNIHDGSGNSINSTSGSLNVDVTNTVPISGTIAATQSGTWSTGRTWTLTSGTDSISSVQSGTWNLNNISGTISLPTGASTSAKQPALGTAGSASVDVITVQGIASMTALKVDGSAVTQPISGSVSVSNFPATQAVTQSGSWSIGRTWDLASGTDSVSAVQSGTWNIGTLTSITNPVAVTGTFWQATQPISAVSLPLPTGASTSANQTTVISNQTNGSQKSQIVDGSNNVIGPVQTISGTNYFPVVLASSGTSGSTVPTRTIQIGGSDGTNLRSLLTDTSGKLKIDLNDGYGNPITSTTTRSTVRGIGVANIDGPQVDSYNRLRVVSPSIQFASYFSNTNHPLYFSSALTGSATTTYNSTLGTAELTTTTSASDSVVLQTKRYFRYLPGVSTMVAMSGILGPQTTNLRKRLGYFDTQDGFFFEQTATDVAVTLRTSTSGSPVDTRYPQSSWNIDKLDGTGPSGLVLDSSKMNLYVSDFVWQGAGRLRFGIINGGTITYFHEILNSNTLQAAFMRSPSRPGRAELTNLGTTAGTNNMNLVCAVAMNEGLQKTEAPYTFGATRGRSSITASSTALPLISIQPNITFNGVTNRVPIVPIQVDVSAGTVAVIVQVILNPTTLTGSSFAAANSFSAAEIDISATAVSGGIVIFETLVAGSSSGAINLSALSEFSVLGTGISGSTPDIITVAVTSTAGNTTTFGGITWQEYQ